MIVVDASVWVSYILEQDVHHRASQTWLDGVIASETLVVVPTLLLVEVSAAVTRRATAADGRRAKQRLQEIDLIRWIPLDEWLAEQATDPAADVQLRGADAVYAVLAEVIGVPLVSWDREHLTRASQRITVYTPANAP